MSDNWKRDCGNCEHACVCDYEKHHAFCNNWYGWIPVDVALPKEHEAYIEDEPITVSDQVCVKVFDSIDNTTCYGTMKTLNGKFSPVYTSLKVTHWKPYI